ncbi:MAG: hypothetical protein K2Z81_00035 [Cyanobacteria bacterium]|nr:hypothetical protein [Cyanobacteriota bacterium]
MGAPTFLLRDNNPEVVKAWRSFFGRQSNMDIQEGDALESDASVIVTPINSFGILDSGFSSSLNDRLEGTLEPRVRKLIEDKHAGELSVGMAEAIRSGVDKPKLIVVAPTVRVPPERAAAGCVCSYLSTRAALRAIAAEIRKDKQEARPSDIDSVVMVGMGTGEGKMPPAVAAFQMYEAYCQIVLGREPNFATIEAAKTHDNALTKSRFV